MKNKQGFLVLILGIMIGANVVMGAWVVSLWNKPMQTALGATADTNGNISIGTGRLQSRGESDALYIYDHESKKIAVYVSSGNRFELLAVRDTTHDWKYVEFPAKGHRPSVAEVKKETSKKK